METLEGGLRAGTLTSGAMRRLPISTQTGWACLRTAVVPCETRERGAGSAMGTARRLDRCAAAKIAN